MKLKSNSSMATARQVESYRRGVYKGLDITKMPIRPGGLEVLKNPSMIFGELRPYRSIFDRESNDGSEVELSDGSE